MDPATGWAIGGAAANIIGTGMGNQASRAGARASNAFTEKMMKSRHQWEVNDLKKAGLNPILSAGSAPSMGGSAQPQQEAPQIDMPAVISAKQLGQTDKKLDQDQQRINIEKIMAVASIKKALTGAELDKIQKEAIEGGWLSRMLGTKREKPASAAAYKGFEEAGKAATYRTYEPLKNKQPGQKPINLNKRD